MVRSADPMDEQPPLAGTKTFLRGAVLPFRDGNLTVPGRHFSGRSCVRISFDCEAAANRRPRRTLGAIGCDCGKGISSGLDCEFCGR